MFGSRSRAAQREPFSERLSRPKNVTPKKSNKHGSENVPPEDENVRANASHLDRPSPAKALPKPRPPKGLPPRPPSTRRKSGLETISEEPLSSVPGNDKIASDSGVTVIVRVRPMRADENELTPIVHIHSSNTIAVVDQQFVFDAVAGVDSTQKDIFEMVGLSLVENCMAGFNSSIFAYGQTGSGKTYTMWGPMYESNEQYPNKDRGLTPRVFEHLFERIQEEEARNTERQMRYQCRCSFLEIYNEQITDLLEPNQKNLQIREDAKSGVYVENLTEEYVTSVNDVTRLALRGLANRKVRATSMNAESSRSHSVFTCVLESRCKCASSGLSILKTSRINLVDLAGSERQKATGTVGERLKEAGNINRSLSHLGNLIKILAEVSQTGKQRHIPYRDSRLTFLLQESLGGNAKLAMICAISPAASCRSETLSTLRFAQRAKNIKNKAIVNEETENDVNFLRDQIRQLKDELMRMKSKDTQPASSGGYSNGWNARRSYNLLKMSLSRPLTLPQIDSDSDEEMEIDESTVEVLSAERDMHSSSDGESSKDSRSSSSIEKEETQEMLNDQQDENGTSMDNSKEHSRNPSQQLTVENDENNTNSKMDIQLENKILEKAHHSLDSEASKDATGVSISPSTVECPDSVEAECRTSVVQMGTETSATDIHPVVERSMNDDDFKFSVPKDLCVLDRNNEDKPQGESKPEIVESKEKEVIDGDTQDIPVTPTVNIITQPSSPVLQSPPLSISPRINERRSISKSSSKSSLRPHCGNTNSEKDLEVVNLSFSQPTPTNNRASQVSPNKNSTSPTDRLAASIQHGLQLFDQYQQTAATRKSSVRFSVQAFDIKTPPLLLDKVDRSIQTSPEKEMLSTETAPIPEIRTICEKCDSTKEASSKEDESMNNKSQWQLTPVEGGTQSDEKQSYLINPAVEGVLAGSIRRELAMEELCNRQAAKIEHLNRLIAQYKHERQCTSIIQQAREEKIARLEGLVGGVISTEEYLKDELESLAFQHKLLQEKYQNHPEVTQAKLEESRIAEELQKYKNFYELGEREVLLDEIRSLRTQLQYYLDTSGSRVSTKKLRKSLMLQATPQPDVSEDSTQTLCLPTIPEQPSEMERGLPDQKCQEENREWREREKEWIALVDDLKAELSSVTCVAEKRQSELESEQRCSEEVKEALQMAIEGHARILDQYAELQEKYMALLAKHRRIKEGVSDAKRRAVMAGAKGAELALIEKQAEQISALIYEREQERKSAKEEIEGLQAQLRDTSEAVQAAGELVVRLKEAEEAVILAQDTASRSEHDAEELQREIERMRRRHGTELAALNQKLLESRLQKSSVCPMCQVAERAKYEFDPSSEDVVPVATENNTEALPCELDENDDFRQSWYNGYDRCNI